MIAIKILTHTKILPLIVRKVVFNTSVGTRIGNIDLCFENENTSHNAFEQLRESGIKCYHAGRNALGGPTIMIYACDKNDFQLLI